MFRKLIASKELRQRVSWTIAGVLILPFILFFHATGRGPGAGPGGAAGRIFGRAVDWDTYQTERSWVLQQWQAQFEDHPDTLQALMPSLNQMTWDRLTLLTEARRQRVRVSDDELAEDLQAIPAFQDHGRFIPERYFRYLQATGMTPQRFESLRRHDLLIGRLLDRVREAVTLSEADLRDVFARAHERLTASVIRYDAAAYQAAAAEAATNEAMMTYYAEHLDAFRTTPTVTFDVAGLTRAEAAAALTPDDGTLQAFYEKSPERFTAEDGSARTFGEARDTVRDAYLADQARRHLTVLAVDLEEDRRGTRDLAAIAADRGLTIQHLGPRDVGDVWSPGPEPALLQAVFELDPGALSRVIETAEGVYLAQVTARNPATLQPFDDVREGIRQRLIDARAVELARAQATRLRETVTDQRAQGWRVEEALLTAAPLPVTQATFGRRDPIDGIGHQPAVNATAFQTPLGELTDVLDLPRGAVLLRPEQLIPADFSTFAADQSALRQATLEERQNAAVAQLMNRLRTQAGLESFVEQFSGS